MNPRWLPRALLLVVLLALAGVVALTVHTLERAQDYRATVQRRTRDLEALAAIRVDLAAYESARAAFETASVALPSLTALVGDFLPNGPVPELRDLSEPGLAGWQRRRHELSFDPVPAADAIALALAAEKPLRDADGNERPGWRLVKCVIRPAPAQPGTGRVVLVMEALVRE